MTFANYIPVMIGGQRIGSARVHDNGDIEIISGPNPWGKEIFEGIRAGRIQSMTITTASDDPTVATHHSNQIQRY